MFIQEIEEEVEEEGPGHYLIVEERNGIVEAVHRAHVAVVDPKGDITASSGDPELVSFTRSCIKPIQALPVLYLGAAEEYGFEPKEIAIIAGSHSGQDQHIETVRSILEKADIEESSLKCRGHPPFDKDTSKKLGGEFMPIHDNCSGKHAGALALCKYMGWDMESYTAYEHPLQREIVRTISSLTDLGEEDIHIGKDGCDIPNYAFSLTDMAHLFALLAENEVGEMGPHLKMMRNCMMEHPLQIGGRERFDTVVMEEHPGKVISKAGAQGLQTMALMTDEGWRGISAKVEDGSYKPIPYLMYNIMAELGVDEGDLKKNKFRDRTLKTRSKAIAGSISVLGSLRIRS